MALTTVDLVLAGETAAYGLCRPPGHHAARSMYGGYCFFNNAAIAAEAITRTTGERVAILDVDYHHGNGTQQIFWRRGDVRYVSIHADPDRQYPYFLGRADETGEGEGAGENHNLPLPAGATDAAYLAATDRALEVIADAPGSVIVVSLGFDTYGLDPIGDFALTTAVYHEIGRRVAGLGRRLVILQEGGYHRPSLGENARAWLRGAEGRAFDPMPAGGFGERRVGDRLTDRMPRGRYPARLEVAHAVDRTDGTADERRDRPRAARHADRGRRPGRDRAVRPGSRDVGERRPDRAARQRRRRGCRTAWRTCHPISGTERLAQPQSGAVDDRPCPGDARADESTRRHAGRADRTHRPTDRDPRPRGDPLSDSERDDAPEPDGPACPHAAPDGSDPVPSAPDSHTVARRLSTRSGRGLPVRTSRRCLS